MTKELQRNESKRKNTVIVRAYHGTDRIFPPEELDVDSTAWLTDSPSLAATFGPRVLHLEIEASNPYEIDWGGCSWGGGYFPDDAALFEEYLDFASAGDEEERRYWEETGMCTDMFADLMSEKGYDLLILHGVLEASGYCKTEYAAMKGCAVREVKD